VLTYCAHPGLHSPPLHLILFYFSLNGCLSEFILLYGGFFKLFLVKLSELNPMDVNFTRKSKIYGKKKCFDLL
jgi:hypothetical protein